MTEPKHDPRAKIEAEKAAAVARSVALDGQMRDLKAQLAELQRERAHWDDRSSALSFALEALGPAPRRGRPAAGNGTQPAAPRVRKAKAPKPVERTADAEDRE